MTTRAAPSVAPRSPTALPTNSFSLSGLIAMSVPPENEAEVSHSGGAMSRFFRRLSAEIVAEKPLGVLGLVALGAEVLPVAPVRRVVVVVAVLVVDGEQVKVLLVELARAARADPTVQRQRARAVVEPARAGLADDAIDVGGGWRMPSPARAEAAGRHWAIMNDRVEL